MTYGRVAGKCAACFKRTQCPGKRYNDKIRYLCQRDYCVRMRSAGRGKQCGSCGVRVFENMVDCWMCDPGGRKVSTEGKSASGQTPDSGSIPGYSTSEDTAVMLEDIADLQDTNKELRKELDQLKNDLKELESVVFVLSAKVTNLPHPPGVNPFGTWGVGGSGPSYKR